MVQSDVIFAAEDWARPGNPSLKLELILTGLSEDNLDVANELIRNLKREIAGLEEQIRRQKEAEKPKQSLNPKIVAKEAASFLWNLNEILQKGSTQDQRRFMEYFVQSMKVNGRDHWVEATFYGDPQPPGGSFCLVPPTGFEPVSRT